MTAVAVRSVKSRPRRSAMVDAARLAASRMEPSVARAFLQAVERVIDRIDLDLMRAAVAHGSVRQIESVIAGGGDLDRLLAAERTIEKALLRAARESGGATAEVLSEALDAQVSFNALSPAVARFVRLQSAKLVRNVTADTRVAIREALTVGHSLGVSIDEQARVIRTLVGLAPNHAAAPLNLGDELRRGEFTSTRKLSAADKAQIESRLANGTIDDEFIAKMQKRYAEALTNLRAKTIARTEALTASHAGQHESWTQAIKGGYLPKSTRRFWMVTNDERLAHDMVPGMNPDGRGMNEEFDTPEGPALYPPSRPNCRCGISLGVPGFEGIL